MLSVSGFFDDLKSKEKVCEISVLKELKDSTEVLDNCPDLVKELNKNNIPVIDSSMSAVSRNYFGNEVTFYYIWKILFSQFLVAMLIGIVLQLLWEDRPITEPL